LEVNMTRRTHGFTLVELLVVIGIIALLVSILLPALGAARRQANAIKCGASLREIGNAFQMYGMDNKGWWPPSQFSPGSDTLYTSSTTVPPYSYTVNNHTWPDGSGVGTYWFNFVSKYVTKKTVGTESANGYQTYDQRTGSIFWGCPAWEGYITGSVAGGGYSRVQTGYGMNGWPTFRIDSPTPFTGTILPPIKEGSSALTGTASAGAAAFHKDTVWGNHASERLLIADSLFWLVESTRPPADGTFPGEAEMNNGSSGIYATNGTTIDWYRHGKYPSASTGGFFSPNGGKVAYNILYCDGHVSTATDRSESYRAARMHYPG
jgi:prepilin-type N-terminal cleavage/methylation domain-containing protein/prepilin-type processing-associated H-X9-DG protein